MNEPLVAFTAPELAFLLGLRPGPSTDMARSALKLTITDSDEQLLAAGLSSLAVRAFVELAGDAARPVGPAAVIGHALTSATRCVEFGLLSKDAGDGGLLFESSGPTVMLSPRQLGCFDAIAVKPELGTTGAVLSMTHAFIEQYGAAGVFVVTRTITGEEHELALRTEGGQSWQLIGAPTDPEEGRPVSREEAINALEAVLARAPAPSGSTG